MPAISTYTLIHWAFETSGQVKGYGFPFDRPHLVLYQRLKTIHTVFQRVKNMQHHGTAHDNKPFQRMWKYLEKIVKQKELQQVVAQFVEKAKVFDELRFALSITLFDCNKGLNDDGEGLEIATIEKKVRAFRDSIKTNKGLMKQDCYRNMLQQIEKYWEKLFADPIFVETPFGDILLQPQRTNNSIERLFRDLKRKSRKKSGNSSLNRTLKTMLEDTPLVKNLENEAYVKILLGDCKTLEERFAQIDHERVLKELERSKSRSTLISPHIRKIIKDQKLPQTIEKLFSQR